VRALSLWQPFASLMAIGAKKIETRHWATDYRGEVAIHAAKRWTGQEMDLVLDEPFLSELAKGYGQPFLLYPHQTLPLGAIVAFGELAGCFRISRSAIYQSTDASKEHWRVELDEPEMSFGNYEHGRFGWVFRNVRRLATPIPYRGQQGLWTLEPATVEQINQEATQ
jgi:hypothetical protein